LCAGFLVRTLTERTGTLDRHAVVLTESARIALAVVAEAERHGGLRAALATSAAAQAVECIGLASDLDWCAAVDVTTLVPSVVGVDVQRDLLVVEAVSAAVEPEET